MLSVTGKNPKNLIWPLMRGRGWGYWSAWHWFGQGLSKLKCSKITGQSVFNVQSAWLIKWLATYLKLTKHEIYIQFKHPLTIRWRYLISNLLISVTIVYLYVTRLIIFHLFFKIGCQNSVTRHSISLTHQTQSTD